MDYSASMVYLLIFLALAQSQIIYNTKTREERRCTTFFTLDSVSTVVKSLLKRGDHASGEIAEKVRFGLANLYHMKIDGLDQVTLREPLEFERLPVEQSGHAAPIRVRITLNFNFLEVDADMKVRYTNSRPQKMKAFVKPTQLVIALDFRGPLAPDDPLTDDRLAYVSFVKITSWEGIRVSGDGFWLRLFRLIHGQNQLDSQIRSTIEKVVKKKLQKVFDEYRLSKITKILFSSLGTSNQTTESNNTKAILTTA